MERVSTRIVYQNRWMTVREDQIRRADGSPGIYGVIDKPAFSIIAAYERAGLWLVEQYRYTLSGRYWEFPQGTYPDRRDGVPEDVARTELAEECELAAQQMTYLGQLFNAPGMSSQACHVFAATGLSAINAERDPEEADLRAAWFPQTEVEAMILDGRIVDASTIAAYTLAQLRHAFPGSQEG
jgi:8-oxo-dGTP pyrophosphatase MutT (NUDIX family)